MPLEIELIPDRMKMLIVVYRDGKAPHRDRFDPVSAKQRGTHARAWGVEADDFDRWCEEARIRGGSIKHAVAEPEKTGGEAYYTRAMEATRASAAVHAMPGSRFVKEILPSIPVSTLAEWDGPEFLCCLDIDYHETRAPDKEWLETVVRTAVSPEPIAWHFSRSGGLHLFYVSAGSYSAEELAACAALRFRTVDSSAGLELKSVVRGPGAETVFLRPDQDTGSAFLTWLGNPEFDETARDAWLESESMECGRRYEHDKCPIDRSEGAERQPVLVSEAGIYCFRCNGKGLTFGSRRAGWAPWSAILGSPSSGELGGLVRNLVHWGHARWVLTERYGLPLPFARIAYRAALKAYHEGKATEALIPRVFDRNTDEIARVNNQWMRIEHSYPFVNNILNLLRSIPGANTIDAEGKVKPDEAAVVVLNQTMPLDHRGYRNIQVVHGFKLAGVFLAESQDHTVVSIPNPTLSALTTRGLPKYVVKSKRMDPDSAWKEIETILPRIDRTYIRLLIAAFGCSQETRMGLLPIIFASGPTSTGKTAMAQVAAGIIGARVGAEATFDPEPAKFRAGIFQGGQEGPVVVFNELLKDATRGRHKLTVREALDFVLNMTPHSTSHVLYRGPTKMGRLPTLVITDTAVPPGLNEETQLARRIRHHYVSGRKDEWKETIARAGVTDLHLIRTASDQVARACDAILSECVDEFFSIPMTWDEIADLIGVKTIEHSDEFTDPTPWLRELFRLVCAAPALSDRDAKLYARGYKKITRQSSGPAESESELSVVYTMFADGPGSDWATSRRLQEKEWSSILKADDTVRVDIRGDSSSVFIRFRVGPAKKPTRVNEEIIDPSAWEKKL